MGDIEVRTWTGKESLRMTDGAFVLSQRNGDATIPFSQVISFSVRDPRGKMRPGMITIKLGGSPDAFIMLNSFVGIGNSQHIEFPHAIDFLESGHEMKARFASYLQRQAPDSESKVSCADEILKYKRLLDMDAITAEEFNAKKKELLGS